MAAVFCVVATPRTGSTHLCSLLNSHPEICCHQELFEGAALLAEPIVPVVADRERREREPLHWLDAVIAASCEHDPSWRAIGFKLHLLQWPSVLERILFEPGFAVLLLDRADRLAQYASRKIVDQTRLFRSTEEAPEPARKVRFDADEFATFARQHQDLYRMVRTVLRGRADVLELDYSGLLEPGTHHRILSFLGVDPSMTLTAPERKKNPVDVLARFTNSGEAAAVLKRTSQAFS